VILRLGTGSLAAARKGHYRARHFGTTFTFLVQIFFACGAQHIICTQRSSGRWASQQPRCKRALRACSYRTHSIRSQVPFSLASRWQAAALVPFSCTTAPLPRSAALTVAALAAMCSAFRLLACRCTALLGPCASPVHGSCPALLRVAVLCVVLIGG
jgi:hypothetical protein